jgi:ATP-dependent DNA helicase RecG
MLEQLLARDEGKTLEFKENTNSIQRIVQTAIAFANTAGGVILLGIKDTTKEVVGQVDFQEKKWKFQACLG